MSARSLLHRFSIMPGLAVALATILFATPAAHAKAAPLKVKLTTSQGQDAGTATFVQKKKGVEVKLHLKNLPVGDHAVHIHQYPKCDAPDFKTAGGHFNPDGKKHGMKNPEGHHNGDLPQNITIGEDHTANVSLLATGISLDPTAANSLFANGGTSIMVHEKADDMMTDPTGNAGNRIACGVITAPTMP